LLSRFAVFNIPTLWFFGSLFLSHCHLLFIASRISSDNEKKRAKEPKKKAKRRNIKKEIETRRKKEQKMKCRDL
jgi:hypothetical protein